MKTERTLKIKTMDSAKTWGEAITVSLIDTGKKFIYFFPKVLGAILILFIGWIIAVAMGRLVARMVLELGLDRATEKLGFRKKLSGTGLFLTPSVFIGGLFKWFLALVFFFIHTDGQTRVGG